MQVQPDICGFYRGKIDIQVDIIGYYLLGYYIEK